MAQHEVYEQPQPIQIPTPTPTPMMPIQKPVPVVPTVEEFRRQSSSPMKKLKPILLILLIILILVLVYFLCTNKSNPDLGSSMKASVSSPSSNRTVYYF